MRDLVAVTPEKQPFPYQEEGGAWIATRERAGLLDQPGLGKTAQAIRAADLRRARRGVVIGPAHLRANWVGEFRKFSTFERRVCKGRTTHDFVAWSRGVFDVIVISYETAVKWRPHFDAHAEFLDFVAIDEFHYLNNLETARARAVLGEDGDGCGGIVGWAVQAWAITGTLMHNDPSNCYALLRFTRALDMPFATFVRRYFRTRASTWGQRCRPKEDAVGELRQLIANNSIRRTFDDVGVQLPPIFLTTVLVDGDTTAIRELLGQHPGLDGEIVRAVTAGGLSFLDAQHVATMRRLVAEAKALPYAEMLLGELADDPGRKVVVMGISRVALQMVHEKVRAAGVGAVIVQGGVSEKGRDDAMDAFQGRSEGHPKGFLAADPNCRVFVGNMRAAGTGLTLTASCRVDILESDWTPAANDQAIMRVRRIGQERTQHARFITLARSLDEVVNRVVAEKTAAIARIDGGGMITSPEIAA